MVCTTPQNAIWRSKLPDLTPFIRDGHLPVKVTPNASRARLEIRDGEVRAYVTVVPENGKANKAVIKMLAKHLGVPKSAVGLVKGETSRLKIFQIT